MNLIRADRTQKYLEMSIKSLGLEGDLNAALYSYFPLHFSAYLYQCALVK